MLQDSLGGNSKTCLIITASPSMYNAAETLSTCRFGMRAKSIKNNAKINKQLTVAELKLMLSKSESENARLTRRVITLEKIVMQLGGTIPEDSAVDAELFKKLSDEIAEDKEGEADPSSDSASSDSTRDSQNSGKQPLKRQLTIERQREIKQEIDEDSDENMNEDGDVIHEESEEEEEDNDEEESPKNQDGIHDEEKKRLRRGKNKAGVKYVKEKMLKDDFKNISAKERQNVQSLIAQLRSERKNVKVKEAKLDIIRKEYALKAAQLSATEKANKTLITQISQLKIQKENFENQMISNVSYLISLIQLS